MKILFVTNIPSPYRVDFFNELAKKSDLTVCYERKYSTERDSAWKNDTKRNFKEIFCNAKEVRKDMTFGIDLIRKIRKTEYDHLIVSGYRSPSVILLLLYCIINRISYCIETDGGFEKSDRYLSGKLKKILINGSKVIFTTCEELIRYYKKIGYNGIICKYPFSSFFKDEIIEKPADKKEKDDIRKQLCMKEEKVVITVGRFSYKNGYGKGYDKVLKAAKHLNDKNIGWYIIGGKPTDEFVEMAKNMQLNNIHYIDFKSKEELKKYYMAADVFVLMTISDVWGLVVNEAMACGLPVITTDKCIAGVEMIENGKNGFVIPVGDYKGLAQKVNDILSNETLISAMAQENIEKVKYWTIEEMAASHIDMLEKI